MDFEILASLKYDLDYSFYNIVFHLITINNSTNII